MQEEITLGLGFSDWKAGDVVFFCNNEEYTANHTGVVLSQGSDADLAHCTKEGVHRVKVGQLPIVSYETFVYRLVNRPVLAHNAAQFASWWTKPEGSKTKFSENRAYAVSHAYKNMHESELFFDFNAIRRALKWSLRDGDGDSFSKNQGATCCAFVTACYQAAAFSSIERGKRVSAFDKAKELANPKPPWRNEQYHEGKKVWKAYKEISNAGSSTKDAVLQIVKILEPSVQNEHEYLINLLTNAMYVDAKYVYSTVLMSRVIDDNQWTQVRKLKGTKSIDD